MSRFTGSTPQGRPSQDAPTTYIGPKRANAEGREAGGEARWRLGWPPLRRSHPTPADPTETNPPQRVMEYVRWAGSELKGLVQRFAQEFNQLTNRVAESDEATAHVEYAKDVHASPPSPSWLYWTLMGVVTIGELAFLVAAFAVFGDSTFLRWGPAVALGIVTPICSHFAGKSARDLGVDEATDGRASSTLAYAAGVAVLGFIAVSIIRAMYLGQAAAAGVMSIQMSPLGMSVLMFMINIAIFGGASLLAYSHARSPIERDALKYQALRLQRTRDSQRLEQLAVIYQPVAEQIVDKWSALIHSFAAGFEAAVRRTSDERWVWPDHIPVIECPNFEQLLRSKGYAPEVLATTPALSAAGGQDSERVVVPAATPADPGRVPMPSPAPVRAVPTSRIRRLAPVPANDTAVSRSVSPTGTGRGWA